MAIESANIVGYAQNDLQFGFKMVTPQFVNIGVGDMDLQSLKAVGESPSDAVFVQKLDAGGYTIASYGWNDWAADEACWVDDDYNPIEGVTFAPGTGLWVQGASADQGIQSAGQVGTDDVVVTLRFGFTAAGNPFPTTIGLQDIVAEGESVSDSVFIQTLDAGGYTLKTYGWNDWACDDPCWVDDDYQMVEGITFAPGQGLWVQGASDKQSIRIPAPEL